MALPFTFCVNPAFPPPLAFPGFFFNEPAFYEDQAARPIACYLLDENRQAVARFVLLVKESTGHSPLAGPFGSVEFEAGLAEEALQFFWEGITAHSQSLGLSTIALRCYPACYAPAQSQLLEQVLTANGFAPRFREINFHLPVSSEGLQLHYSETRKLKRAINEGFIAGTDDAAPKGVVFDFISRQRKLKNIPVTLSREEYISLFEKYPGRYFLFTVYDRENLVAAATGVKVNDDIFYYFFPSHDAAYNRSSPMVLLIKEMYAFAQKNKYKLLDLGIATSKGVRNEGLIRFKQNLGAVESSKSEYYIPLT